VLGHVIAGTRGLRAENARVEARGCPAVPASWPHWSGRYPDVAIYTDKQAMLAAIRRPF